MDNRAMKFNVLLMKHKLRKLKANVVFITALFFANSVLAVDIAQTPLFLDHSATPNIMFIMDDSGSMDWDILTVPHRPAKNYDHDLTRSWAKGGWINRSDTPVNAKYAGGKWDSYPGRCYDRNTDGICFNSLDLNGNGYRGNGEDPLDLGSGAIHDYKFGLYHLYYRVYSTGKCSATSSNGDASDYLPNFDKILAFLTGSKAALAHELDTIIDPVSSFPTINTTSSVYDKEEWKHVGSSYDIETWDSPAPGSLEETDKGDCLALNKFWVKDSNYYQVIHGPDQHPNPSSRWIGDGDGADDEGFTSAGSIDVDGSGANLNSFTPGDVGDYHKEFVYDEGLPVAGATVALDINGNGLFNDGFYNEVDYYPERTANYEYIQDLSDNTYTDPDRKNRCVQANRLFNSASACEVLDYPDYLTDYDSGAAATSQIHPGRKELLDIGTGVTRVIRSTTWSAQGSYEPTNALVFPLWAQNTRHAMSEHDPWPLVVDWRPRSSDFNVLYYNPENKYTVWPGITEALPAGCTNKFLCARSNPQSGTPGYSIHPDLARVKNSAGVTINAGFVYEVWDDDAGYFGSKPEWTSGNSKCSDSTDGAYTLPQAVVDPADGAILSAGEKVCFTYLDQANGEIDLWDSHYRVEIHPTDILVQKVRRTPHLKGEQLYTTSVYKRSSPKYWEVDDGGDNTGYYDFTASELEGMKVALSDTKILGTWDAAALYANTSLCIQVLGQDDSNPAACKPLVQVQQNVANWYQYSRKRSFVAKGAIAQLITEKPDLNYGLMGTARRANSAGISILDNSLDFDLANLPSDLSNLFLDVFDGSGSGNGNADQAMHNSNLREGLYNYLWRQSDTPLRQALQRAGEYFAGRGPTAVNSTDTDDHDTSPITESCQKNFALLLTDGYWNGVDPATVSGVDKDGSAVTLGDSDGDGFGKTLADVAKYYYDEDLSPLVNDVRGVEGWDENNAQHLTTIGVGFGVTGSLSDDSGDGWPGSPDASGALPYTESSTWGGDPASDNQFKIDDLWHAAYNSRGLYLNAKDPEELIQRLNDAILFATAEVGSGSAVSVNSNTLSPLTRLFQTTFNSTDWSGDVRSFPLNPITASLLPSEWSAKTKLNSRASANRKIFTMNAAGNTVPFLLASLDAAQVDELRKEWPNPASVPVSTISTAYAQAQINYIRGDDSAQFRDRAGNKLGDIVHSEATFVAEPKSPYFSLDGDYAAFRTSYINRIPTVYVGANDGMLHAFDASTNASHGDELFAYIPNMLIPRLNSLTHKNTVGQNFVHKYFVDATPTVGDAYFGGAWHTTLVSGLGAGGKGVYALDITNAPANQEPIALWEFTDSNSADMGYSFSKPIVVKLNDSNESGPGATMWGAIFGNGYDSDTGKAVLYVINIKTGAIIKTIDTGVGDSSTPNGLSSPTVIDTDGDLIADRVYAGDLLGNVWSFDISASNSSTWSATKIFTANTGQPITQKIAVQEHPLGALAGYLLHFGTGQFFRPNDNNSIGQDTQSIYAIWDCDDGLCSGLTQSDLLEQVIEAEVSHATVDADLRVTSSNEVTWLNDPEVQVGDSGWQSHIDDHGWHLNLYSPGDSVIVPPVLAGNYGERVVTKAVLYGRAVLYSTLLPATDGCDGGGSGWLMSLSSSSGARHETASFDITGNGTFTSDDYANWTDSNGDSQATTASGVKSKTGIPSLPLMISGENGQGIAISDHSSTEIGIAGGADSDAGESDCTAGLCGASSGEDIGRQSWIQLD